MPVRIQTDNMGPNATLEGDKPVRARFLCALLLLVPMVALAQAYKCKRAGGKTSFQDQPCDVGRLKRC